jgi:phosphoglycerate dehydrogenase-like enzyme
VFEVEPLPAASPLWEVGNDKILLSPHNADITDDVFVDTANFFADAAEKFVANGTLPEYLVDIHGKGY